MTKYEKKRLLSRDEYDYLMAYVRQSQPIVTQVNYYYDTDDLSMYRQNITCRIRLRDRKYRAVMKRHTDGSDRSEEIEMEVYDGIYDNAFTAMGLKIQGELVTRRCTVYKSPLCEAVLDKNEYLGKTDYELEIEYEPEHEREATSLLHFFLDKLMQHRCAIAHRALYTDRRAVPSKSDRFFERRAEHG